MEQVINSIHLRERQLALIMRRGLGGCGVAKCVYVQLTLHSVWEICSPHRLKRLLGLKLGVSIHNAQGAEEPLLGAIRSFYYKCYKCYNAFPCLQHQNIDSTTEGTELYLSLSPSFLWWGISRCTFPFAELY